MIFSAWRIFSFVWIYKAIQVAFQENSVNGAGMRCDPSSWSKEELLDHIWYARKTGDDKTADVLQSYL